MSVGLTDPDVRTLAVYGASLFAGTYSDGVFLSKDSSSTWVADSSGFPKSTGVFALTQSGNDLFAGTWDQGIFLSADSGATWIASNEGLTDFDVSALTVNGSYLFAGTAGSGIFLSTNNGTSWNVVNTGLTSSGLYVSAMAVIGTNLFAGTLGGVFLSTNDGSSWTCTNSELTDSNINALAVSGTNLFTATYGDGVSFSTDSGKSWTTEGMANMSPRTLAVCDASLYIGTEDSGVWRRPLSDFGISSVSQTQAVIPSEIQIYPNPFSQSTEITFTSSSAGYAEVSIVNMLGVEVARLFSGELGAGEHNFTWSNSTGLPDGTYECLVRMNGQLDDRSSTVETLPVVLMR